MSKVKEVPVFLFTGFLESGKTKFIQETLEDKRFNSGERTLLIVCEEGEEEYAPDKFSAPNVFMVNVEEQAELTRANLRKWLDEHDCERCVIEYNGMWMLDDLYQALPEMWMVYQEFFFADARSILSYNANMRNLVYDKLKSAELTVFNRYDDSIDKMELHKLVRAASRRSDIAYEYADGTVKYDEIEDPLPFDLDAPIVEIGDNDYAVWYRDMSEEPKKYENKVVRFKCRYLKRKKVPAGNFHSRPPRYDLLRRRYPICGPYLPVGGFRQHRRRFLACAHRARQLQVQPRLRQKRPRAHLHRGLAL